jgi:hypothetical protein
MRTISATVAMMILAAGPALAQAVYNTTPDWESTDTPYSTGGAFVDLDRDGWLDFVVSNGNDIRQEELAVYYNQGDGTFPGEPDWLSSDTAYNGHLSVADVNGDGWLDVAVARLGKSSVVGTAARLYLNNAGTLSSTPDWESSAIANAFDVAFGDVNNDGRPDLAVATGWPYSSPNIYHNYVYLNVDGQLEVTASWQSDDTRDYMGALWTDADADGWLDLTLCGAGNDTWIYRNLGGVLETDAGWHTTDNPGQYAIMTTVGDVTSDGLDELFVTDNTQLGAGSGYFRQYDGQPGGYFTKTPTWSYYEGYGSAVALADVNFDGYLDLATGAWWDRTRLFFNTGSGLGSSPDWTSAGTSVVEAIVFADVDNDGLRHPVDTFTAATGQHLFQLTRQPIDRIERVTVDGTALSADQYTCDTVHGWITVGPEPVTGVTVHYVYTLKPEMGVTNWDDSRGNYLYYNQNDAPTFGHFDADEDVDLDDYSEFANCLTGPGGGLLPGCEPADMDLDQDVDLSDVTWFQRAFTGTE